MHWETETFINAQVGIRLICIKVYSSSLFRTKNNSPSISGLRRGGPGSIESTVRTTIPRKATKTPGFALIVTGGVGFICAENADKTQQFHCWKLETCPRSWANTTRHEATFLGRTSIILCRQGGVPPVVTRHSSIVETQPSLESPSAHSNLIFTINLESE